MTAVTKCIDVNVGCYNIGTAPFDFRRRKAFNNKELIITGQNGHLPQLSNEEFIAIRAEYTQVEKETIQALNNMHRVHVYCLQEVGNQKRRLVTNFTRKNYTLISNGTPHKKFDTALLIDEQRFKEITNLSTTIPIGPPANGRFRDVAIAHAVDKLTNKRFFFASLHAPGFDLSAKSITDMEEGNEYCKSALAVIQDLALRILPNGGSPITRVVGGDINCNPENGNSRFDLFNEYQVLRTGRPTNVNPSKPFGSEAREAELDFVFVAPSKQEITAEIVQDNQIHSNNNCSDHSPIFARIRTIQATHLQPLSATPYPAVVNGSTPSQIPLPTHPAPKVPNPTNPRPPFSTFYFNAAPEPATSAKKIRFSKVKASKKKYKSSKSTSSSKTPRRKKSRPSKSYHKQPSLLTRFSRIVKNFFCCLWYKPAKAKRAGAR